MSYSGFVLHDEDRAAGLPTISLLGRHDLVRYALGARQIDQEFGALPRRCLHLDVAATLFHDTVRSREAEARALPDLLRREEGLEDLSLGVLVHADTRIPNSEQNIIA